MTVQFTNSSTDSRLSVVIDAENSVLNDDKGESNGVLSSNLPKRDSNLQLDLAPGASRTASFNFPMPQRGARKFNLNLLSIAGGAISVKGATMTLAGIAVGRAAKPHKKAPREAGLEIGNREARRKRFQMDWLGSSASHPGICWGGTGSVASSTRSPGFNPLHPSNTRAIEKPGCTAITFRVPMPCRSSPRIVWFSGSRTRPRTACTASLVSGDIPCWLPALMKMSAPFICTTEPFHLRVRRNVAILNAALLAQARTT